MMFLTIFQDIWTWIVDAFFWCLEGLLGSLQAAVHVYSDVPPLQCILGSAALVGPIILIDIFVVERIKKRKQRKKWEKEGY